MQNNSILRRLSSFAYVASIYISFNCQIRLLAGHVQTSAFRWGLWSILSPFGGFVGVSGIQVSVAYRLHGGLTVPTVAWVPSLDPTIGCLNTVTHWTKLHSLCNTARYKTSLCLDETALFWIRPFVHLSQYCLGWLVLSRISGRIAPPSITAGVAEGNLSPNGSTISQPARWKELSLHPFKFLLLGAVTGMGVVPGCCVLPILFKGTAKAEKSKACCLLICFLLTFSKQEVDCRGLSVLGSREEAMDSASWVFLQLATVCHLTQAWRSLCPWAAAFYLGMLGIEPWIFCMQGMWAISEQQHPHPPSSFHWKLQNAWNHSACMQSCVQNSTDIQRRKATSVLHILNGISFVSLGSAHAFLAEPQVVLLFFLFSLFFLFLLINFFLSLLYVPLGLLTLSWKYSCIA